MRARFAAVVAVLAGGVVAGIAGASTAHASDETAFLADLQTYGITSPTGSAGLLAQGWSACSQLSTGVAPVTIAFDLMSRMGMEFRPAYIFVDTAALRLCPEYGKGIGGWNNT